MSLLKLINNQDYLVIFDVDDVLSHQHRHKLLQSILNLINPQEIEFLKSNIFLNTKQVLVESGITDIFEYLKLHKIPTMALTAIGTGKLGVIKKMHDFRFKQLGSINLSFKHLSPLDSEYIMPELTTSILKVTQC